MGRLFDSGARRGGRAGRRFWGRWRQAQPRGARRFAHGAGVVPPKAGLGAIFTRPPRGKGVFPRRRSKPLARMAMSRRAFSGGKEGLAARPIRKSASECEPYLHGGGSIKHGEHHLKRPPRDAKLDAAPKALYLRRGGGAIQGALEA